jgi:alpha/beta hydrolase family protein
VGNQGTDLFGADYPIQKLIAAGESQSAGRLVTFVNAWANQSVHDGHLIHSRGRS